MHRPRTRRRDSRLQAALLRYRARRGHPGDSRARGCDRSRRGVARRKPEARDHRGDQCAARAARRAHVAGGEPGARRRARDRHPGAAGSLLAPDRKAQPAARAGDRSRRPRERRRRSPRSLRRRGRAARIGGRAPRRDRLGRHRVDPRLRASCVRNEAAGTRRGGRLCLRELLPRSSPRDRFARPLRDRGGRRLPHATLEKSREEIERSPPKLSASLHAVFGRIDGCRALQGADRAALGPGRGRGRGGPRRGRRGLRSRAGVRHGWDVDRCLAAARGRSRSLFRDSCRGRAGEGADDAGPHRCGRGRIALPLRWHAAAGRTRERWRGTGAPLLRAPRPERNAARERADPDRLQLCARPRAARPLSVPAGRRARGAGARRARQTAANGGFRSRRRRRRRGLRRDCQREHGSGDRRGVGCARRRPARLRAGGIWRRGRSTRLRDRARARDPNRAPPPVGGHSLRLRDRRCGYQLGWPARRGPRCAFCGERVVGSRSRAVGRTRTRGRAGTRHGGLRRGGAARRAPARSPVPRNRDASLGARTRGRQLGGRVCRPAPGPLRVHAPGPCDRGHDRSGSGERPFRNNARVRGCGFERRTPTAVERSDRTPARAGLVSRRWPDRGARLRARITRTGRPAARPGDRARGHRHDCARSGIRSAPARRRDSRARRRVGRSAPGSAGSLAAGSDSARGLRQPLHVDRRADGCGAQKYIGVDQHQRAPRLLVRGLRRLGRAGRECTAHSRAPWRDGRDRALRARGVSRTPSQGRGGHQRSRPRRLAPARRDRGDARLLRRSNALVLRREPRPPRGHRRV